MGNRFRQGHHMRLPDYQAQKREAIKVVQKQRVAGLHAKWRALMRAQFGELTARDLAIARAVHRRSFDMGYANGWRASDRTVPGRQTRKAAA